MRCLSASILLGLGACNAPPEPRPGTQIGVEESGGCTDDEVVPVEIDEVPEGASLSLADVWSFGVGRFVGTTREGAPLTLEVEADEAVWVTLVTTSEGEPHTVVCPPRWRLEAEATVRTDVVDWVGSGPLFLEESGEGFLLADGPPDVGEVPPADVDANTARLTGFGVEGAWSVGLAWRGQAGPDGDAVDAPVFSGEVAPE